MKATASTHGFTAAPDFHKLDVSHRVGGWAASFFNVSSAQKHNNVFEPPFLFDSSAILQPSTVISLIPIQL